MDNFFCPSGFLDHCLPFLPGSPVESPLHNNRVVFSVVSRFQSSERHDVMISSSRNLCRVLATGRLGGRMHHMARHSLWIKILVSSFTDIIVFGKYSDYYTNLFLYYDTLENFSFEKYFRINSVRNGKTIKELRSILKSFHDGLRNIASRYHEVLNSEVFT